MSETEDHSTSEGIRAAMRRRAERLARPIMVLSDSAAETCDCADCTTIEMCITNTITEALLQAYQDATEAAIADALT